MRIAQIADLWHPATKDSAGGRGFITGALTEELVKAGHEVTLFASGDSTKAGRLISVVDKAIKRSDKELTDLNLSKAYEMADQFDVIHNHVGHLALPYAAKVKTLTVTTLHYPSEEAREGLKKYGKASCFVSISMAMQRFYPEINFAANVYNGIYVNDFIFNENGEDFFLFLGRISPDKGVHNAIEAAKIADGRLLIAGMVPSPDQNYFDEKVKPFIDGEKIKYIGEVDYAEKIKLFSRAKAVLHPIDFFEPFGLTLVEAMASGTPVIAFNKGSIPELVADKKTGFVVENVSEMAEAMGKIGEIDRKECRKRVEENFTVEKMVEGYEDLYEKIFNF